MPELERDLALLSKAARAAGQIALNHFKSDVQIWDKEDNAGPVTEADLAIDAMLKDHLMTARPAYGWLSEETEDDHGRLSKASVFIVDPIDGTRAFIDGKPHWGHSLALATDGVVVAGAVYMPMLDILFTATKDGGAFANGEPIHVSGTQQAPSAKILAAKSNLDARHWPGGFPGFERSFRSSLAYRLCLVAQGAFDGMLTLRPTWEWDVAAGSLIVAEAGGMVTDQHGQAPRYNSDTAMLAGMVATNTPLHGPLIKGMTGA